MRKHHRRTIVVCNSIRGAQTLYRLLQQQMAHLPYAPELLLLHQYLFARDRQRIERRAAELFGRGADANALLITTSGIEVGADISADTLITEPAPPDQLLRRAGRCARFDGEVGRLLVAAMSDNLPEAPYAAPDWREMVNLLADGQEHNADDELAVYDQVWTGAPRESLPEIVSHFPDDETIDALPTPVMARSAAFPAHLFTHIGAALHRIPESVRDPFELERLPVALSSLERGLRRWQASGCTGEWFALTPQWAIATQRTPSWAFVESPRDFHVAARLVILNADAVSYSPDIGLEFAPGHAYQSEQISQQKTTGYPFDQHIERFEEHALRALNIIEQDSYWFHYVMRRLGGYWRIPQTELDSWLRLAVLWHDAGKLTADWQRAANRWQAEGVRRPVFGGVFARVDYQAQRDGAFPCPAHAQVSGLALTRVFARLLNSHTALYQGTIAALCHHHGGQPLPAGDMTPHPEAWATLMELAGKIVDDQQLRRLFRSGWNLHPHGLPAVPLTVPSEPDAWMAYSLLVRAIRLADREVTVAEMLAE
jgi:CRISPR-associated endonuclease/helicase Cas3